MEGNDGGPVRLPRGAASLTRMHDMRFAPCSCGYSRMREEIKVERMLNARNARAMQTACRARLSRTRGTRRGVRRSYDAAARRGGKISAREKMLAFFSFVC